MKEQHGVGHRGTPRQIDSSPAPHNQAVPPCRYPRFSLQWSQGTGGWRTGGWRRIPRRSMCNRQALREKVASWCWIASVLRSAAPTNGERGKILKILHYNSFLVYFLYHFQRWKGKNHHEPVRKEHRKNFKEGEFLCVIKCFWKSLIDCLKSDISSIKTFDSSAILHTCSNFHKTYHRMYWLTIHFKPFKKHAHSFPKQMVWYSTSCFGK